MPIQQQPFVKYHAEKKADTFTTRINAEERQMLERAKQVFQLPMEKSDSKAWKMLALVGYNVLHSFKIDKIIESTLKRRLRE